MKQKAFNLIIIGALREMAVDLEADGKLDTKYYLELLDSLETLEAEENPGDLQVLLKMIAEYEEALLKLKNTFPSLSTASFSGYKETVQVLKTRIKTTEKLIEKYFNYNYSVVNKIK